MNRNHLIAFALTIAVLGLLAALAWHFLEIHPRSRQIPPSAEAAANEYLALDRWLEATGRPVRLARSGNLSTISAARERRVFMQASLFHWTQAAVEYLARWIEDGGTLFLVMDNYSEWGHVPWIDGEIESLLERFGIEARTGLRVPQHRPEDGPSFPARDFSFHALPDENALAVHDTRGNLRLIRLSHGSGRLIVSGMPLFLRSTHLDHEPNARLAWTLFAAQDSESGWLFIRGRTRAQGLWGSLFRHGNLAVAGVSALMLLAVGFWTVIPMFGLVRHDNERPGKPLRERFAAEGSFLKRYGALGFYRDIYIKEIRRRLLRKEGLSTDDEIIGRVKAMLGKADGAREIRLFASALGKDPVAYRDFPQMIHIFKTILERI
ncbi:MAG: DUF4350 domain-containing protein [Treponema sp.]|nr:DUF4350 domain-containing protein [Treponema sp.]